ncbi:MAG: phage holin family protein [Phycisphaerales bacterium]
MFLWRAKELLEGGGELLKAEAELAGMRLQRMLVGLAFYGVIAILGLIGLLTLLSGLSIMIARWQGWAVALLIVGGIVLVITTLSAVIVSRLVSTREPSMATGSLHTPDEPPQAEAAQAKERMADAMQEKPQSQEVKDNPIPGLDQLKDEAVDFAVRNPMVVGSAALLAISAIGPLRSVRLISRGLATAGLVGSLADAIRSESDKEDKPSPQSQTGPQSHKTSTRKQQGPVHPNHTPANTQAGPVPVAPRSRL